MPPSSRLTHTSNASYRRYMQMSSTRVFVFIEGITDRYFYNKLCEAVFSSSGTPYEICLAQELPDRTGGKESILRFYSFLNNTGTLLDNFKGKTTGAMFFVDKDIDDLLGRIHSSDHVVYTEHYSLENYFYSVGNLVEALAVAAQLDMNLIRSGLNISNDNWRRRAAENWKDWVKLCLFCRIRGINYECNYSVNSRINTAPYAPIDATQYNLRLAEIERRSGLTPIGFKRVFNRISKLVDGLYDSGQFDVIFRGKWYSIFLAEDARRIAAGRAFYQNSLPDRLETALQSNMNFGGTWAEYFKAPLRSLVGRL